MALEGIIGKSFVDKDDPKKLHAWHSAPYAVQHWLHQNEIIELAADSEQVQRMDVNFNYPNNDINTSLNSVDFSFLDTARHHKHEKDCGFMLNALQLSAGVPIATTPKEFFDLADPDPPSYVKATFIGQSCCG